tara:strand:+ start:814 stop:1635 length:822 start_codon:yes stop_codon:yes gene_type:complete
MDKNFELFEQALNNINKKQKFVLDRKNKKCCHKNKQTENGLTICVDCGIEINQHINFDKEWRYYGASDTRHNSDPNRCHIRKNEEKSIIKDVRKMGFSDKIILEANKLYETVTKGKIYRGNSRKAIIFACIFHSYKLQGNPQSCEQLIKIFNLDKKIGLKGLKHVNLNAPKNLNIRTSYITPENLVKEIMNKFNSTESQIQEVIELYAKVKNRSSILNRSRPQSVAAGLVRYYILLKDKGITMSDFKEKVQLSELTINRIVKEIGKILENLKE